MLKSANLLHKCCLGDSDISSTVWMVPEKSVLDFWFEILAILQPITSSILALDSLDWLLEFWIGRLAEIPYRLSSSGNQHQCSPILRRSNQNCIFQCNIHTYWQENMECLYTTNHPAPNNKCQWKKIIYY